MRGVDRRGDPFCAIGRVSLLSLFTNFNQPFPERFLHYCITCDYFILYVNLIVHKLVFYSITIDFHSKN